MRRMLRGVWFGGLLLGSMVIGAGLATLVNATQITDHLPAGPRGLVLCGIGGAIAVMSAQRLCVARRGRTDAHAEFAPTFQSAPKLKAINISVSAGIRTENFATDEPTMMEPIQPAAVQVTHDPVSVAHDASSPHAPQMPLRPASSKPVRPPQGPKIVAIGGGTGMPQLLRGLRAHTDAITAIVTVADDGGSSGRLRRQMGMLPPGDFRNNIAALSESEDLITRLFQYRFASHEFANGIVGRSELGGHSFGNLFIATMAAITGSFEAALAESSRVLAVRGRVLPSTLELVHLCAEIRARQGTRHIIALDLVAAQRIKHVQLLGVFHTFGEHRHVQIADQLDNGGHHHPRLLVLDHVLNKAAIDLDGVHGQSPQV